MTKYEFIEALRQGLSGLPKRDIEEQISFYGEMIDDRIEEGACEEDAVEQLGNVNDLVLKILKEIPLSRLVKEKVNNGRRLNALEIILLILGSPIWFSLLVAAFAVLFSLYVSLWAVLVSLWAVAFSFIASAFGGIFAAVVFLFGGNTLPAVATIGASVCLAGLSVLLFIACKFFSKGVLLLTKKAVLKLKAGLIKKEKSNE